MEQLIAILAGIAVLYVCAWTYLKVVHFVVGLFVPSLSHAEAVDPDAERALGDVATIASLERLEVYVRGLAADGRATDEDVAAVEEAARKVRWRLYRARRVAGPPPGVGRYPSLRPGVMDLVDTAGLGVQVAKRLLQALDADAGALAPVETRTAAARAPAAREIPVAAPAITPPPEAPAALPDEPPTPSPPRPAPVGPIPAPVGPIPAPAAPTPAAAAPGPATAAPAPAPGPGFLDALTREGVVRWIDAISGLFILLGFGILVSLVHTWWVHIPPLGRSVVLLGLTALVIGGLLAAARRLGLPPASAFTVGIIGLGVLPLDAMAIQVLEVYARDTLPGHLGFLAALTALVAVLAILARECSRVVFGEVHGPFYLAYVAGCPLLSLPLTGWGLGPLASGLLAVVPAAGVVAGSSLDLARREGRGAFGRAMAYAGVMVYLFVLFTVTLHGVVGIPLDIRTVGAYLAYAAWMAGLAPAIFRHVTGPPMGDLQAAAAVGAHGLSVVAALVAFGGGAYPNVELLLALALLAGGMGLSASMHKRIGLALTSAVGGCLLYVVAILHHSPELAWRLTAYPPLTLALVLVGRAFGRVGLDRVALGYLAPALVTATLVSTLGLFDRPEGARASLVYAVGALLAVPVLGRRYLPTLAGFFLLLSIVEHTLPPDDLLTRAADYAPVAVATAAYTLVLACLCKTVSGLVVANLEDSPHLPAGSDPLGGLFHLTAAIAGAFALTELPAVIRAIHDLGPGASAPDPSLAVAPGLLAAAWAVVRTHHDSGLARASTHAWLVATLLAYPFLMAGSVESYRLLVCCLALAYALAGAFIEARRPSGARSEVVHLTDLACVLALACLAWASMATMAGYGGTPRVLSWLALAFMGPAVHRVRPFPSFLYVSHLLILVAVQESLPPLTGPTARMGGLAIACLAIAIVHSLGPVRRWVSAEGRRHGPSWISRSRLVPPADVVVVGTLACGLYAIGAILTGDLWPVVLAVRAAKDPELTRLAAILLVSSASLWMAFRLYRSQGWIGHASVLLGSIGIAAGLGFVLSCCPDASFDPRNLYPLGIAGWGITLATLTLVTSDLRRRKVLGRGSYWVLVALASWSLWRTWLWGPGPHDRWDLVKLPETLAMVAAAATLIVAGRGHRGLGYPGAAALALLAFHSLLSEGLADHPTEWVRIAVPSLMMLTVATDLVGVALLAGPLVAAASLEGLAAGLAMLGLASPLLRLVTSPTLLGWPETAAAAYALVLVVHLAHRLGGPNLTLATAFLTGTVSLLGTTAAAHSAGIVLHQHPVLAFGLFGSVLVVVAFGWHGVTRLGGRHRLLAPLRPPQAHVAAVTFGLLAYMAASLGIVATLGRTMPGTWEAAHAAVCMAVILVAAGLAARQDPLLAAAGIAVLWAGAFAMAGLSSVLAGPWWIVLPPLGVVAAREVARSLCGAAERLGLGLAAQAADTWGRGLGLILAIAAAADSFATPPHLGHSLFPWPPTLLATLMLLHCGVLLDPEAPPQPPAWAPPAVLLALVWAASGPAGIGPAVALAGLVWVVEREVAAPLVFVATLAVLSVASGIDVSVLGLPAALPLGRTHVGSQAVSAGLLALWAAGLGLGLVTAGTGRHARAMGIGLSLLPVIAGLGMMPGVPDGVAHGVLAIALALAAATHLSTALADGTELFVYTAEVLLGLVYVDLRRADIIGRGFFGLLVLMVASFALLGAAELARRAGAGGASRLSVLLRPGRNTALALPLIVVASVIEYGEVRAFFAHPGLDECLLLMMVASFYALAAHTLRYARLYDIAAVALNAGLFVLFRRAFSMENLDFYTIPAGLTVLWFGWAHRPDLSADQRAATRLVGLIIMFSSPTVACLGTFDLVEFWVLLLGAVVFVLLGAALAVKNFFYGGLVLGGVALASGLIHWSRARTLGSMLAFLALGATGLAMGAILRKYRREVGGFLEDVKRWE